MSNTTVPVANSRAQLIEQAAWIAREAERLAAAAKTYDGHAELSDVAETIATIQQELHLLGLSLSDLGHDSAEVTPRITRSNGRYIEAVAS